MSSTLLVYPDSLTGPYSFKQPTKAYFARAFADHDGSGGGPGQYLRASQVAPVVDEAIEDLERRVLDSPEQWAVVVRRYDIRSLRRLRRSLAASEYVGIEWAI